MTSIQSTDERTILVAEDEATVRRLLADMITQSGLRVIESVDGQDSLDAALREHPDLILLDILMPKLNGLVVLDTLRRDAWGATVPVIILSNVDPDYTEIREMQRLNVSLYLMKTRIRLEEIVTKIHEVLGGQPPVA